MGNEPRFDLLVGNEPPQQEIGQSCIGDMVNQCGSKFFSECNFRVTDVPYSGKIGVGILYACA